MAPIGLDSLSVRRRAISGERTPRPTGGVSESPPKLVSRPGFRSRWIKVGQDSRLARATGRVELLEVPSPIPASILQEPSQGVDPDRMLE